MRIHIAKWWCWTIHSWYAWLHITPSMDKSYWYCDKCKRRWKIV